MDCIERRAVVFSDELRSDSPAICDDFIHGPSILAASNQFAYAPTLRTYQIASSGKIWPCGDQRGRRNLPSSCSSRQTLLPIRSPQLALFIDVLPLPHARAVISQMTTRRQVVEKLASKAMVPELKVERGGFPIALHFLLSKHYGGALDYRPLWLLWSRGLAL